MSALTRLTFYKNLLIGEKKKFLLFTLTAGVQVRKCKGFPWEQRKQSVIMRCLYLAGVRKAGFDCTYGQLSLNRETGISVSVKVTLRGGLCLSLLLLVDSL